MNPSPSVRIGSPALVALAVTAACFLVFAAQASALSPLPPKAEGSAVLPLKQGTAGKAMKRAGVKVSTFAGGKVLRSGAVRLPVRRVYPGSSNEVLLGAGFVLKKGKRKVKIQQLEVRAGNGPTVIKGALTRRNSVKRFSKYITAFTVGQRPVVISEGDVTTIRIAPGALRFSNAAARAVSKGLGLKKAPRGTLGNFRMYAKLTEFSTDPCFMDPTGPGCPDPYLAQCGVEATSVTTGNLPVAAPLPTLTGAKTLTSGNSVSWGFKSSFRSYVIFGASGSLQAVDPATVQAGMGPVAEGFNFPVEGGEYAANDLIDTSDDQAIVSGTGTSLFCATGHGFRIAISNPTVVIDGANSRLVADVDTNLTGAWTPTQRIDIATLDLSGVSPFYNKSGSEVSWSDIPVSMTQGGADVVCGTGEQAACSYTAGTELDPIDVTVKTPYDTSDLTALASYVETELPFPISNPTQGGCTLPNPADGNRTIDAAQAANPSANPVWKSGAGSAAALPGLSGSTAVTGGGFDWGFRSSLRGSINATGEFNLALGATASDPDYYGNGGNPPVFPRPGGVPGEMSGPGKFFTWPAASAGGQYSPAGGGKLVLRTVGRVAFCQTQSAQVYGTVFSNPTIVIDGANSRIQMDVATRYRLSWVRGTVDIATLNLAGITPVSVDASGTTTVSWTFPDATGSPAVGPVTLTADGEAVVNMLFKNIYISGLGLDGATIRASFPTPAG